MFLLVLQHLVSRPAYTMYWHILPKCHHHKQLFVAHRKHPLEGSALLFLRSTTYIDQGELMQEPCAHQLAPSDTTRYHTRPRYHFATLPARPRLPRLCCLGEDPLRQQHPPAHAGGHLPPHLGLVLEHDVLLINVS